MSFADKVVNEIITRLKNFVSNVYEWAFPEKGTFPSLVYRVEVRKSEPLRLKLYRKFPDKTRWAVAKVELNLHLFFISKTPPPSELEVFLKKLSSLRVENEKVECSFGGFLPFEEEEFIRKGVKVWHGVLELKFTNFVDTPVLNVKVSAENA